MPAPCSLGLLNQAGERFLHRHMPASPEPLLQAMAPAREALVVCVAGLFTWSWLADLCAREGRPGVLGPARSMQAIHGGKATHEQIDAPKMAVVLRSGRLPHASVYPADMRAPRDRLRRRRHVMRTRAEWRGPLPPTTRQYHLPAMGTQIADKANRDGVAERLADPAGPKRIEVDLALMGHDDALRRDIERSLRKAAQPHDAPTLSLRRTGPGSGESLSLVLLYEIQDLQRFPRVQDFVSDGRLVKCAKESAGKRDGPAGTKIGHAYLTWAFSEAAVLFLRANPAGQKSRARLEKTQGQGKALTVLAQKLARAVYDMWKRDTKFDLDKFFN